MTDQPTTPAPQGAPDRAEDLRKLSDFELGQLQCRYNGPWERGLNPDGSALKAAAIDAEWARRCAEREAQEAELERLRKQLDAARLEAAELTSEINAQGWSARCWDRLQTLNGLLIDMPQPQEASE